ncbi:acyl-CoA/acyl-ACP dehydrogenase [Gordonia sp. TBRC 11910]|uniref:Acyl-CoA/acyl-ACP dehydrogenase n=1 Tax=Gordonia asplenii TaxID=2725283 RepID=A0A848KV36_9ACTN|nr:acyl-CoA dehydrogenase family protein [Gordonia asplenii]NMO00051.1 acyl-CoA/acyl-ACP dehydrogenase [Gordonia asplenii]
MTDTVVRLDEADLAELTATVAAYCRERFPDPIESKPGHRRDPDVVRQNWHRMAAELGIGALLIPDDLGGADATLAEATRVAETLSAELAPVPFLTTAVFAPVLLAGLARSDADGADDARELLGELAKGTTIATVAFLSDHGDVRTDSLLDADGTATGSFGYVLDADVADVVLLVGSDGAEIALARGTDLSVTPRTPFDLTRGLADVTAHTAPVRILAAGTGQAAFAEALAAARLALAADSSGGAVAALDDATGYARERIQFGRPVGSFQALKHILADRFVDAELALSVSRLAVDAAVDGVDSAAERLALARFFCADRFVAVAADNIQIHGGMGFTAECRAHLYRRRAATNRNLFGSAAIAKRDYTDLITNREENR